MEYKYKTKGDVELVVPDVGISVNGILTSTKPIENPNLELITDNAPSVEQPAPAHMNGVVPQNAQPVVQATPQTQAAPAVESNNGII